MGRYAALCCAVLFTVQLVSSIPVVPREEEEQDEKNALLMQREDLFEGDIAGIDLHSLKTPPGIAAFRKTHRNGVLSSRKRWTDQKVPYLIADGFTTKQRDVVQGAIDEINRKTNVLLTPRTNELNYIFIQNGAPNTGCYSYVGRVGGRQVVNLQTPTPGSGTCITNGIAVHEITHAIGFYHEQSRTDRDQHVEINWDNIAQNQQHNFVSYDVNTVTHFEQLYDYDSVMHYGKFDFAINRTVYTIRPKAPFQDTFIGQRVGLSPIDVAKMNAMYPRPKDPQPSTVVAPTSQTGQPTVSN